MFHRLRKAIITQSTSATLKQTEDMVNDAERIWNTVYFLDPNKDIAFELGRVMMGLKKYFFIFFHFVPLFFLERLGT